MDHPASIECPCCSGHVTVEQMEGATVRAALPCYRDVVDPNWEQVVPRWCIRYQCTVCNYDWLEATFYDVEGTRVVHITYGLAAEVSFTMRAYWRDVLEIGLEEQVGVVHWMGSKAIDYPTWYHRLTRQREHYRRKVSASLATPVACEVALGRLPRQKKQTPSSRPV